MSFRNDADLGTYQNIIFNGDSANIEQGAIVIYKNIFSQTGKNAQIDMQRGKYGGACINWVTGDLSQDIPDAVGIGILSLMKAMSSYRQ